MQYLTHAAPRLLRDASVRQNAVKYQVGAEVGGEDDDGVFEIHRSAAAVCDPAVVKHLKQDVENVGMSFFDLIEQHHGVGLAAHCLGKLSALIVAHVSGRRSDKARDREFLHIFAHVDTDKALFIIEQRLGKSLCKLGLADAGGA